MNLQKKRFGLLFGERLFAMEFIRRFVMADEKELYENNRQAVYDFSATVVPVVTAILGIILGGLVIVSFKLSFGVLLEKVYAFFFAVNLLYFAVYRLFKRKFKNCSVFFLYVYFALYLTFALVVSYANDFKQEYVSVVCVIFIIPILLLDRSYRVNIFTTAALAVALYISYSKKSSHIFSQDIVNLVVYYFAGMTMGFSVRRSRLRGYDTERVLTYERNTDSLTKLANRRKLFEYLQRGNESLLMRPTGMFMIDIDDFKKYNDHYGHRAGDICLGLIGKCFSEFGEKRKMKFFRYGGEEFCGLCWSMDYMELASCAEELLQAVRDLRILFNVDGVSRGGIVTISVGYAFFDREKNDYNFETMIKITDAALYSAKSHGRNCARGA